MSCFCSEGFVGEYSERTTLARREAPKLHSSDWNLVLVPSVTSLLVNRLALGPLVGNIENSMCEFNTTEPIRDLESNLVIASE